MASESLKHRILTELYLFLLPLSISGMHLFGRMGKKDRFRMDFLISLVNVCVRYSCSHTIMLMKREKK